MAPLPSSKTTTAAAASTKNPHPVYDPTISKRLQAKENRLIQVQNAILQKRRKQASLLEKQRSERNAHFTHTRLKNWKTLYNIVALPDQSLRPPDKSNNIRTYSNMDKDMWDGGERGEVLRGWFLQNAPEIEVRELYNPEKEGFLVRNPHPRSQNPQVYKVEHPEFSLSNPRKYSVPAKAAGFPGEY